MRAFAQMLAVFGLAALHVACGVTAGNPGSGGKTHSKLSLFGSVQILERGAYAPMRVGVVDAYGVEVTYAISASNSTYAVDGLAPGEYWVQIGAGYRQAVSLTEDTLLNVILPLPAAPSRLRFVELGPSDFCLLWSDNSAVETGFRVTDPRGEVWDAPADSEGVRFYAPVNVAADSAILENAALQWNVRFEGRYVLAAWNEYGISSTAAVEVSGYAPNAFSVFAPPPEVPRSEGNPEKEVCLSVERNAVSPQFIGP